MRAYERLLKYVKIPTASNEESEQTPSSNCQFDLAHVLVKELLSLGVKDARSNEKCYVYGSIPPTKGYETRQRLGFIAHMDTVSDEGKPVKPLVHNHYNGLDLPLGDSGKVLEVSKFPKLPGLAGRTLITSDGTTILGADDKAGIAEIMTMVERLQKEQIPHGKICIGFTPDEEIGRGADAFELDQFGADYAYTVDGGAEGEIEYENFNACSADFEIRGFSVHPGSAKDVMVNAGLVAMEINGLLPKGETPRDTEGYEGFYCLTKLEGTISKAKLSYIIRDHDTDKFQMRQQLLRDAAEKMNKKYGRDTVKLIIREQYLNMAEKIKPCFHLIENARLAVKRAGIEPSELPIRGGTDGARLSYMGLPCPNLGTGGYAFHGPYEHITAEGMDLVVETLLYLAEGRV